MCGIAGYIGPKGTTDALRKMAKALERRGSDDEGFYEGDGVGFAFRRLSIVDIQGGHQPMSNEDGSIWVMQNGEIYGYRDLRRELEGKGYSFHTTSDTETIIHAYKEWGESCFEYLNGMFAIAIWDTKEQKLLLARDRIGKKPLYWMETQGTLWFASEPKALLAAGALKREIDPVSLALYFRTDSVPTPRSIFKGLQKLEPGTVLSWKDGERERMWSFWKPDLQSSDSLSEADVLSGLRERIDVSVRERLIADVPLGLFLSGGLDSSIIAESAARQSSDPVKAFTIGFEDATHDERDAASIVAKTFGMDHHVDVLSASRGFEMLDQAVACLDEPLADAAILPQLLLAEYTRKHVKVAVAGDGGDELLIGYQHIPLHAFANAHPAIWKASGIFTPFTKLIPAKSGYFSSGFKVQRLGRGLGESNPWKRDLAWRGPWTSSDCANLLRSDLRASANVQLADELFEGRANEAGSGATFWQKWSWAFLRTFLMDQVMVKVDRSTMWMGLEARAPLLDPRVVEYVLRVPDKYKIGAWSEKRLFKELLRNELPSKILNRPKHGFGVPVAGWIRSELSDTLQRVSSPDFLGSQGLFEPKQVKKAIDEHQRGWIDRRKELYSFLMFQRWYEQWFRTES